jgi:UDP-N-acetylmuramate--alanine ligase
MNVRRRYFLCGVGGSGMLPLALMLVEAGHSVEGSDRALDQGRTGAKFEFLRARGVRLYPQDGSGVRDTEQIVVASAAVEETVPDIVAARRVGARIITRAALLAQLFNAAPERIGIGGTSGKSTVTAMTAWVLHSAGIRPSVMNGAVMKNFAGTDAPFASALVGDGRVFVSELDESDGSIALFEPTIAIVTNISLDHKSMDELRALFADFARKARVPVLNSDNDETARLAAGLPGAVTFGLESPAARFIARAINPRPDGVSFDAFDRGSDVYARVDLKVPGRHNVSNALAAIAAAVSLGVSLQSAAHALNEFAGVRRRLEVAGAAHGVTVIDDFAHNPDKISASLRTLHEFSGRLLVMFQPHGFGPLKKMRQEFIDCFLRELEPDDRLYMPEPVYFGGVVDRSVSNRDIIAEIAAGGRAAFAYPTREMCGEAILQDVRAGDRIIVMGARDDTLTQFAADLVAAIDRDNARR